MDRYDALTGEWTMLDSVQDTHCYSDHSGVASDDGTIYLFGGYSESYEAHDTVVKVTVSGDDLTFSTATGMGLVSYLCHWARDLNLHTVRYRGKPYKLTK